MNAQAALEKTINSVQASGRRPTLLLHACCAPCASYVLEYLTPYFDITVFFFNPNIYPEREYTRRREELRRLLAEAHSGIPFVEEAYDPGLFYKAAAGHEADAERGQRCALCYALRLEAAAAYAAENSFDYFTTTLSIGPHKDAAKLNETGPALAAAHGVDYLVSDFKKKNGYQRSLELSRQYGLYRQEYCGCEFSMRRPFRTDADQPGTQPG